MTLTIHGVTPFRISPRRSLFDEKKTRNNIMELTVVKMKSAMFIRLIISQIIQKGNRRLKILRNNLACLSVRPYVRTMKRAKDHIT